MTPAEYTTALSTLGLTTEQAAKWLGIGRSTAFRYAVDGAPGPVARALGMAVAVMEADRFWPDSSDDGTRCPQGKYVRHSDLTAALGPPAK